MCEHEDDPEFCNSLCQQFCELDYQLQMSHLPKACWGRNVLNTDFMDDQTYRKLQIILQNINEYVQEGHNLFLYGEPGCGKTSWSIKCMNNYFAHVAQYSGGRIPRGLFVSVPSFLRDAKLNITYKDEEFRERLNLIQTCDIVIWDDICQTQPSLFESQWMYSYINERLQASLCNIFTSNLSPEKLSEVDKRLASRICTGADVIMITGPDMRCTKTFDFGGALDGTSADD